MWPWRSRWFNICRLVLKFLPPNRSHKVWLRASTRAPQCMPYFSVHGAQRWQMVSGSLRLMKDISEVANHLHQKVDYLYCSERQVWILPTHFCAISYINNSTCVPEEATDLDRVRNVPKKVELDQTHSLDGASGFQCQQSMTIKLYRT